MSELLEKKVIFLNKSQLEPPFYPYIDESEEESEEEEEDGLENYDKQPEKSNGNGEFKEAPKKKEPKLSLVTPEQMALISKNQDKFKDFC